MRRFRAHPTPFGAVAALALVAFLVVGPEVADPGMAGFVWASLLGLVIVGAVWPCVTVLLVKVDTAGGAVGGAGVGISGVAGAGTDAGEDGAVGTAGEAVTGQATRTWAQPVRPIQVGESASIGIDVGPRLSEVGLHWLDSDLVVPIGAGAAMSAELPLVAVRRGRFSRLVLRVSSDAPFGLVVASRGVEVPLPRPLDVGPRAIPVDHLPQPDVGALGELATTAAGHGGDTTRSVRPYVVGDPAHLVHWPTSARTGDLVVREMEPPADMAVAVVVDLGHRSDRGAGRAGADVAGAVAGSGGDAVSAVGVGSVGVGDRSGAGADADSIGGGGLGRGHTMPAMPTTPLADGEDRAIEGAVARAAAVVDELRARGVRVLLCTAEPAPTVGEVSDHASVLSRLAAATTGSPGQVPAGWSVLRITPRGDDA